MGRASSSKKVQRAARAAGRPGTGRNWLWPAAVVALVALGVTLVWISRGTDQASAEAPPRTVLHALPPLLTPRFAISRAASK